MDSGYELILATPEPVTAAECERRRLDRADGYKKWIAEWEVLFCEQEAGAFDTLATMLNNPEPRIRGFAVVMLTRLAENRPLLRQAVRDVLAQARTDDGQLPLEEYVGKSRQVGVNDLVANSLAGRCPTFWVVQPQ